MKKTIKAMYDVAIEHQEKLLTAIENVISKCWFAEMSVPMTFVRDVVIWEIQATEGLGQDDFYEIFDTVCSKIPVRN